jgi:signal transduction histidine kinase
VKEGDSVVEVGVNQYQLSLKSLKHEIENLENVNQTIRKLSHSLAPVTFKGQSFKNLIEDKITELFPVNYKVNFQCLPEEELDKINENLKFNVYRILQNLSANIINHANATEATIQVIGHKDHLNIIVEDNGEGYITNNSTNGIGLELINKRVFLKNGTIEINSILGEGTTVIIDLPYNNKA